MRVAFHTMGCKVNQFDTAVMSKLCGEESHEIVSFDEAADVFVINTCSVTENGNREARRVIRGIKKRHPESRVIVTGCYAQTHPEELSQIRGVDLVLGHSGKDKVGKFIEGCRGAETPVVEVSPMPERGTLVQPYIAHLPGHTRVFLKIQDGCDFDCSFCLIPRARGVGRSLPADRVVEQVQILEKNGCKEVVLTGVNLGMYGRESSHGLNLPALLSRLLERTTIQRIRLSSIEPKTLTPDLMQVWQSSTRICRHFHIPLQSGDDTILKKMNRHYSRQFYRNLIGQIYDRFPDAGFGTDVLAGFPGEGESEFRNTLELIESLPFQYVHVFPYSPRPETASHSFGNAVEEEEKNRRVGLLRKVSERKRAEFMGAYRDKLVDVLVEKVRDPASGNLKGLSDNYMRVVFNGPDEVMNRIARVRVGEAHGLSVRGSLEADSLNFL